ncbi:hypothetical protein [Metabacillus litoralis]|nr:hypothetical protein [Metabacillus litoralis]
MEREKYEKMFFIQEQDFLRIIILKWTMSGVLPKEFIVRKDNCWDELE